MDYFGTKNPWYFVTLATVCMIHFAHVAAVDWILHNKFRTLENSLIKNKNLSKFIDSPFSEWNNNYLRTFENKVERSYDNAQCIDALQFLQYNLDSEQNAFESKNS